MKKKQTEKPPITSDVRRPASSSQKKPASLAKERPTQVGISRDETAKKNKRKDNKRKDNKRMSPLYEPRTKTSIWVKATYFIVALVAIGVVLFFSSMLFKADSDERLPCPMTLNNEPISHAEFSFVYHYLLLENGINVYDSDARELLASPGEGGQQSLRYNFLQMTAREICMTQILYDDAVENGYSIEESHRQMAISYLDWLEAKAFDIGVSIETYVRGYFGNRVTPEVVFEVLSKKYFADDYASNVKLEQLRASDDQAEQTYEASRHLYDLISYRMLRIVFEETDDSFIETAHLRAQQIIDGIGRDESQFETVAAGFFTGNAHERLLVPDATLYKDVRYITIQDPEWRAWLFDERREPGDTIVFEDEQGFPILLCFSSRERQNEALRSVRILSIYKENNELGYPGISDEKIDDLAMSIYDSITDFSSMQVLETTYADDILDGTISSSYYTDIYKGMLAPEQDEWIFDGVRQPGEKTLIRTDDMIAILYFVETSSDPEWFDRVNSFIRMDNYQAFLLEMETTYTFFFNEEGLAYIRDIPTRS